MAIVIFPSVFRYYYKSRITNMGKSKLEFYAKITTSDGREITKRVEEEIPATCTVEGAYQIAIR